MATISQAPALGVGFPSHLSSVTLPCKIEKVINFATAATAKGSALAAADIITALTVPAGTCILAAGAQVVTATNATTLTIDIGTTVDADVFADGFDLQAAAVAAYTQHPAAYQPVMALTTSTVDVLLATLTGTLTSGSIRVWALVLDVSNSHPATTAKLGS